MPYGLGCASDTHKRLNSRLAVTELGQDFYRAVEDTPYVPSLYIGSDLRQLVRERQEKMERLKAKQEGGSPDDKHVPERKAMESLLSDDAKKRLERIRESG